MCIRDSGRRADVEDLDAMVAGVGHKELAAKDRHAARAAQAVSYTHLRAHETVLDLVCRLLLEKKK